MKNLLVITLAGLFSTVCYADTLTCYFAGHAPVVRHGTFKETRDGMIKMSFGREFGLYPINNCIVE